MTPLFVSFRGVRAGKEEYGFAVVRDQKAISTVADLEMLCERIEQAKGYDPGCLVPLNFRRLEDDQK